MWSRRWLCEVPDTPAELDAWLAGRERQAGPLVPGTEKHVAWAGEAGQGTALAIVRIHGFSASARELAPVPELVARALGANLFLGRLAGHGRMGRRWPGCGQGTGLPTWPRRWPSAA